MGISKILWIQLLLLLGSCFCCAGQMRINSLGCSKSVNQRNRAIENSSMKNLKLNPRKICTPAGNRSVDLVQRVLIYYGSGGLHHMLSELKTAIIWSRDQGRVLLLGKLPRTSVPWTRIFNFSGVMERQGLIITESYDDILPSLRCQGFGLDFWRKNFTLHMWRDKQPKNESHWKPINGTWQLAGVANHRQLLSYYVNAKLSGRDEPVKIDISSKPLADQRCWVSMPSPSSRRMQAWEMSVQPWIVQHIQNLDTANLKDTTYLGIHIRDTDKTVHDVPRFYSNYVRGMYRNATHIYVATDNYAWYDRIANQTRNLSVTHDLYLPTFVHYTSAPPVKSPVHNGVKYNWHKTASNQTQHYIEAITDAYYLAHSRWFIPSPGSGYSTWVLHLRRPGVSKMMFPEP